MLTFLIVLGVLYFTGLLPFVFAIVMFITELAFTAFILIFGFCCFLLSCLLTPFKSK
ncbi:membrane protein [Pectobacterium phage Possum]|uniref:Putative membrane protein n=1 Tax=Pectobacterium phage Possum TaxID=2686301 RepID=A0A7U3QG67_9CAUD|nr:membrane protein [Pectobacterium phage Possum]QPL10849.1 putative membrane protein [Pectobacterium phage Possum]QPL10951.1 putative membrane protein [Pectobacterium phage Horatius]